MTFDLYYYFVFERQERYFDNGTGNYFFDKELIVHNEAFQVSLIYENGGISMARIIKKGLPSKIIPTETRNNITLVKEHLLTSINIHFNPNKRIRFDIHLFIDEDAKPDLNILLTNEDKGNNQISVNEFNEIFINSFAFGNELKLISDAQKSYIPIQFRFLSLYKWLELEFKAKGKWNDGFFSFSKSVEPEFERREYSSKKFSNYLHEIRDKCAHIKSNNDILGVTSLSYEDEKQVIEFTKFLTTVCIEYFNQIKLKNKSFKMRFFPQYNIDLA